MRRLAAVLAMVVVAGCGGTEPASGTDALRRDSLAPPVCPGADVSAYWNDAETSWACRWDRCVDGPEGPGWYFYLWWRAPADAPEWQGPSIGRFADCEGRPTHRPPG